MSEDIIIDVGMDPALYLAGADQLTGANSKLQQSMAGVVTTSSGVQKALSLVTPGRATLAGLGGLAAAAAQAEQQLSGLAATSAVTGLNTGKLAGGMRNLAREMPVGNTVARQTVEQFTKMGIAASGSEQKISDLSKGVIRLSGATGEGPGGLAVGMTQFARATGNVNLDTKRFDNLSDSLVRVQKTSGASATDILAFSKNIAPMASAAGIGATGILGISGAFSRLGEDGIGASTAVNKMLTDMSRSAREGGPQMKAYAEIVGTTADEFERMFKENPGEALNKVVDSLAKAGPEGPRQLEMLGLDGVRSQRALQALSASGGLRPAMEQAQDGYGSGDAKKAADAAFGGLNDSFTELTSSTEQLAQILGAPLTTPLKAFSEALKVPVNALSDAAGSKVGQAALTAGGIGLTGFLGAKAALGPLSLLGLGRQAGKSGPVRGILAGLSMGAGDEYGTTMRSRAGSPMTEAYYQGTLGNGMMGGVNTRAFDFGRGMGERLKRVKDEDLANDIGARRERRAKIGVDAEEKEYERGERRRAMNPVQRAADTAKIYGGTALNTYIGEMGRQFENASIDDPRRRSDKLATPEQARAAGKVAKDIYDAGGGLREATQAFHKYLTEAGKDAGSFGETLKAAAQATRQAGGLAGTLNNDATRLGQGAVRRGARAGMAGLGAIGDMMGYGGVAGLGIAAGVGVWQMGKRNAEQNSQDLNDYAQSDMYSQLNAYREASGRAGIPSQAVGAGTAMEIQDRGKTVSAQDAMQVTAEDVRLAEGSKDKKVQDYYGSTTQIAAQVAALNPRGLDPGDINAVKYDLLRGGRGLDEVQEILKALPASATTTSATAPAGSNAAGVAESVRGAQQAPTSWLKGVLQGALMQNMDTGESVWADKLPDWMDTRPGGGAFVGTMSDEGRTANQQTGKGIQARYAAQSDTYKGEYANQERLRGMEAAIKTASDDGDFEQVDYLSRLFQKQLMGSDYETKSVSMGEIKRAGGFSKAFAEEDETFDGSLKRLQAGGGSLVEGEGLRAEQKKSYQSEILARSGNTFAARMFDNTVNSSNQNAIAVSMGEPESASKMDAAVDAFISGGRKAGMSLSDIGTSALKAANELNSAGQAFAIARAAFARTDAQQRRENVNGSMTSGQVSMQRRGVLQERIAALGNPQSAEMIALRDQMTDEVTSIDEGLKQKLVARLETQRQYEKAVKRQTRDFNLSMEHAETDFQTSINRTQAAYDTQRLRSIASFGRQAGRAEQDHQISRERQVRDFGISIARTEQDAGIARARQLRDFATSMLRAEQDFGIARGRQVRDFNTSIERTEADANKSRMRTMRDFNISLARQIADAAKSMYDPYARIQTKATWDARNLMVNLQQQNEAMAKQKTQLDKLREMGLSAQAIDQLQLGKSENAQQVDNLTQDFTADPKLVQQLNDIAKARAAATGGLYTDESNTDLNRAKEDLNKSLSDMAVDLKTSLDRTRADFAKSQKDQAEDFAKNNERARADLAKNLKDQSEDLARNLSRARTDLGKSMKDQAEDFARNMARSATDFNISLEQSHEDLVRNLGYMETDQVKSIGRQRSAFNVAMSDMREDVASADKVIAGDFKTLATQVDKAIHGQAVSWGKLLVSDTKTLISDLTTKVFPVLYTELAKVGVTPAELKKATAANAAYAPGGSVYNSQVPSAARPTGPAGSPMVGGGKPTAYADGGRVHEHDGPVHGPSAHSRSDDVDAKLTAGEFVQPVVANLHYGRGFMEDVRKLRFPKALAAAYSSGLNPHNETGPGYADGGEVWQQMVRWINKASPSAKVTSTVRYGDPLSDHDKRRAIDLAGGPGLSSIFETIKRAFPVPSVRSLYLSQKGPNQIRFGKLSNTPPHIYRNHFDHVHWAMESMKGAADSAYSVPGGPAAAKVPQLPWGKIFKGFDMKRGGIYGALAQQVQDAMKTDVNAKLATMAFDSGGYMQPGTGQHFNGTNKPEPVLTSDQWASISRLAAHGGMTINREQAKGMSSACSHTTNHNSYTYDHSNDFEGAHITIKAEDPNEIGRKIEEKAVLKRVSQTRGVRR